MKKVKKKKKKKKKGPMDGVNYVEIMKKPERYRKKIRFVVISDTHKKHDELLKYLENFEADYLIHCGDFTVWSDWKWRKLPKSVAAFNTFLGKLTKIKHKLIVVGNHDEGLRPMKKAHFKMGTEKKMKVKAKTFLSNGILLNNDKYVIEDEINIFTPSYNVKHVKTDILKEKWKKIPEDTNLLVTHFPGRFAGDKTLLRRIRNLKHLKAHCFGHFHKSYGYEEKDGVFFFSCASFSRKEKRKPFCFDYYLQGKNSSAETEILDKSKSLDVETSDKMEDDIDINKIEDD